MKSHSMQGTNPGDGVSYAGDVEQWQCGEKPFRAWEASLLGACHEWF